MYIWSIHDLNQNLISGALPDSESFKYLMANTILYSLAMIPYMTTNEYDTYMGIGGLVIGVLGLWIIYKLNGGSNGQRILERYMSIGWVVFVRFLALVVAPVFIVAIVILGFYVENIPEESTIIDVIIVLTLEVLYIVWVAKHVNYVARQSNA